MKAAKGYTGRRKNVLKLVKETTTKAGAYAYRDRRTKKRVQRRLWQTQLNNAVRQYGVSYSQFINLLKKSGSALDRKVLSELARNYPNSFQALVEKLKA